VLAAWTSLTAVLTGLLFVAACAYISAVFLTLEARQRGHQELVGYFVPRATAAGAVTGVLAGGTFAELSRSAPHVFHGLTGRALPLVAVSIAAGIAVLAMTWLRWYPALRVTAAIAVVAVVWGWGVAQYPDLIPGQISLAAGSAPAGALVGELAIAGLAAVLVGPAFVMLYALQQRQMLGEAETASELRHAAHLAPAGPGPQAPAAAPPATSRLTRAVVLVLLAIRAIRDVFSPGRRG
jgi:cytochrome d ubiquinol oxidase subunit II